MRKMRHTSHLIYEMEMDSIVYWKYCVVFDEIEQSAYKKETATKISLTSLYLYITLQIETHSPPTFRQWDCHDRFPHCIDSLGVILMGIYNFGIVLLFKSTRYSVVRVYDADSLNNASSTVNTLHHTKKKCLIILYRGRLQPSRLFYVCVCIFGKNVDPHHVVYVCADLFFGDAVLIHARRDLPPNAIGRDNDVECVCTPKNVTYPLYNCS